MSQGISQSLEKNKRNLNVSRNTFLVVQTIKIMIVHFLMMLMKFSSKTYKNKPGGPSALLYVSVEKLLETLAAALAFLTLSFGGPAGLFVTIYVILFTYHWPEAIAYLIWISIDKDVCDLGTRYNDWMRNWTWWEYVQRYFPIHLQKVPWVDFDPKRNYLLCCFPHGIFPMGVFTSFGTNAVGFNTLFPNHKPHVSTLKLNFIFPLFRELALGLGTCNSSQNCLNNLLGTPEGGKAVALVVGGAEEAYHCRPGQYRIVVKKRKGFVKIALRNGSPLVPVFTFGETDLFDQVNNPKGSLIRGIQDWIKQITGVALVIPKRLIPSRKPLYTIVGKPINVEKVPFPTQEQIDSLHEKFVKELEALFEEQKYNYLPNASKVKLVMD